MASCDLGVIGDTRNPQWSYHHEGLIHWTHQPHPPGSEPLRPSAGAWGRAPGSKVHAKKRTPVELGVIKIRDTMGYGWILKVCEKVFLDLSN